MVRFTTFYYQCSYMLVLICGQIVSHEVGNDLRQIEFQVRAQVMLLRLLAHEHVHLGQLWIDPDGVQLSDGAWFLDQKLLHDGKSLVGISFFLPHPLESPA